MSKPPCGFVVAAVLLATSRAPFAFSQENHEAIWDGAIMSQPFDKTPFRQIQIPEWVESTIGCGYTLSGMDFEHRALAAKHGVTISEMGFVDPFYPYYDSKLLKKRSPHVPLGRLEKDIAEYKKLGVRILGVYPPCLQGEVYETHPEWRRISTNTTTIPTIDMQKYPHGGMLCLLGPYGDFFIDVLAEIVTKYPDVDAFSFDGLHYAGVCYCASCRADFRKETGGEIPNADLNDPAFRRYQHWADRRMEDLIRRMQNRLKAIKPEIALVTWTTNAGRYGHFLSIPRNMPSRMNLLLDAPDQEFWLDESNRGATVVPSIANAYIWATTNHRVAFSEPYLMSHGNPYGKDSFPGHEVLRRMLLSVTYGVQPSIAVGQPKNMQQSIYDALDEVNKRKPWITHKKPEYWGAILLSDNTRNFYGRTSGAVDDRYMSNVFGMFRAAMEEHLPMNLINDWNLNDEELARYRVLVLPNAACLDDKQVQAIDRFVQNGGGLVATLDTSAFNEFGDPRPKMALANVLGVQHKGLIGATPSAAKLESLDVNFAKAVGPDYWEKRKNVFEVKLEAQSFLDEKRLRAYVGESPVTFKGPAVKAATTDSRRQIHAYMRVHGTQGGFDYPAVMARTHLKGKVVYLAAGFDSAYYLYAYPYQRIVLKQAIVWSAGKKPPVQIDAPMCVQATVMRQKKDGERLVVHLYNDVNTTAFHAFPNDDVPLREETLPIHDVTVTLDPLYSVRKVHLEPEGQELPVSKTPEGLRVVVPKLEIHAMVVCELDGGGK